MALFDALANLFAGQSPTTTLSSGEVINWNAPKGSFLEPLANAARPISTALSNFNQILQNTDPQTARPLGQDNNIFSRLSSAVNQMQTPTSSNAMKHLSALASASPQHYSSQYANALGNLTDPNRVLDTQIKQEQLRAYQDPLSNPETLLNYQLKQQQLELERAKQQAELDKQRKLRQIMSGTIYENPMGINHNAPAPLSVRNNNPLNMRPVGSDTGFQQFQTPQAGIDAAVKDLTTKISGKSPAMAARFGANYTPNLSNLITTWAPPSENDTQSYINNVAKMTGIDPSQVLTTADIPKLLPAMAQMEGGKGALAAFGMQQPQPMVQVQPQAQPQYLDQLKILSAVDPEKYAGTYLSELANYNKEQIDRETKAKEAEQKGRQAAIEGEVTLRKEFEGLPDVKQFRDVEASYKRIQKATEENTGASDIALIFNYMKMLDPGSTVREGEFATAQNSGGIPSYVSSLYNQAIDGQRLTPDQRNNFLSQATQQYKGAEDLFNERSAQYKDIASQYGYKPDRVVQGPRGKVSDIKTQKETKQSAAITNLKNRGFTDAQIEEYKKIRGIK